MPSWRWPPVPPLIAICICCKAHLRWWLHTELDAIFTLITRGHDLLKHWCLLLNIASTSKVAYLCCNSVSHGCRFRQISARGTSTSSMPLKQCSQRRTWRWSWSMQPVAAWPAMRKRDSRMLSAQGSFSQRMRLAIS